MLLFGITPGTTAEDILGQDTDFIDGLFLLLLVGVGYGVGVFAQGLAES